MIVTPALSTLDPDVQAAHLMATVISWPPALPENTGGSMVEVKVRNLGRQPPLSLPSHLGPGTVVLPPQQNMGVFWMLKRRRKRSALSDSGMVPPMLVLAMLKSDRPVASLHHHHGGATHSVREMPGQMRLARGTGKSARVRPAGCTTAAPQPHHSCTTAAPHDNAAAHRWACTALRTPCSLAACPSGSC